MARPINLKVGRSTITAGVADPGATLDGSLQLLDANVNVLATAATSGLNETIAMNLAAGDYYLRVYSAADPLNLGYWDLGSYFLTGTIPVPEPGSILLGAAAGLVFLARIKRKLRA